MPKLKTKSGAKKRFQVKKSGKVKFRRAGVRHLATFGKTKKQKRHLRGHGSPRADGRQEDQGVLPVRPVARRRSINAQAGFTKRARRVTAVTVAAPPAGKEKHMRVKKGFKARRRRNRVLKLAKGFRGRRKNCYKPREPGRRARARTTPRATAASKRRDFRALWIVRINAAARLNGTTYSQLDRRPEEGRASRSTARSSRTSRVALPADFAAVVKAAQA